MGDGFVSEASSRDGEEKRGIAFPPGMFSLLGMTHPALAAQIAARAALEEELVRVALLLRDGWGRQAKIEEIVAALTQVKMSVGQLYALLLAGRSPNLRLLAFFQALERRRAGGGDGRK